MTEHLQNNADAKNTLMRQLKSVFKARTVADQSNRHANLKKEQKNRGPKEYTMLHDNRAASCSLFFAIS
jgi:hypothetical protein